LLADISKIAPIVVPMPKENKKPKEPKNLNVEKQVSYISLTEASTLCSYSQEYLSLLARKGLIGAVKMGRNWVITREVLFDYVRQNSLGIKGNHKGQLLGEGTFNERLSNNLLTVSIKQAISMIRAKGKVWVMSGFAELKNNLPGLSRQALDGLKSILVPVAQTVSAIKNPLIAKRVLATILLTSLGALSLYVSPVAAKYYGDDFKTIAKFAKATIGRSTLAAKKSFEETVKVYADTLAFVKNPQAFDFKTAQKYLSLGFKNLGLDIAQGSVILANNFSEEFLAPTIAKFNSVTPAVSQLIISPTNVRENLLALANGELTKIILEQSDRISYGLFKPKNTLVEYFASAINTYGELGKRVELLLANKVKPNLLAVKNIFSNPVDLTVEPKVAGVSEVAQITDSRNNGIAEPVPSASEGSSAEGGPRNDGSSNLWQAVQRNFVANFKAVGDLGKLAIQSFGEVPNKAIAVLSKAGNGSVIFDQILHRAGNGFKALADLSFNKFGKQIVNIGRLVKLAYHNIFYPDTRFAGNQQYLTLDEAKQLLGQISPSVQYIINSDGKVVAVVGKQGPAGLAGAMGLPGKAGEPGAQGPAGKDGLTGPLGGSVTYQGTTPVYNNTTLFQSISAVESLTVGKGGIATGGSLVVAGNATFGDNSGSEIFTVNSPATFNNTLTVAGTNSTVLTGSLNVTGISHFASNLSVGGMATITAATGNFATEGNITIGGTLNVGGSQFGATTTLTATGTNTILTVRQGGTGDLFNAYDGGTEVFTILDGGNVGIGTSTPIANLAIQSTNGQTQDLFRIGTSSNTTLTTTTDASFFKVTASGGTVIKGGVLNPIWLGNYSITDAHDVVVVGNYAYVVSRTGNSITILDISNPLNPAYVSSLTDATLLSGAYSLAIVGNYAYIAVTTRASLAIIDISNPYYPKFVAEQRGSVPGTSLAGIRDVMVIGKYAYVHSNASGVGFAIIDVSNPNNPTLVSSVSNGTYLAPTGMDISGHYAYITSQSKNSLSIVDIANPANPVFVSGLLDATLLSGAYEVDVVGKYAYVTAFSRNSLAVIDVASSTHPVFVKELRGPVPGTSISAPRRIVVSGNYAYIANQGGSMAIIDVSSSTNPVFVSNASTPTGMQGTSVYISGNYAYYTSKGSDNIKFGILDISGLTVSNAEIGTLKVDNLSVDAFAQFAQGAQIQGGLNVGAGAMFGGPVAINVSTSSSVGVSALQVNATSSVALAQLTQYGTGNILSLYSSSTLALSVRNTGQTILSALPKTSAPSLLVQPYNTSSFSQTTTTMMVINSASGFTGDLLSLQVDGSVKYRIDYQGNAAYYSTTVFNGDVIPGIDNSYDIGHLSTTRRWRDVSLYRNLNVGAIDTSDKLVRISSTTIAVYNTDLTIQTNNSQDILLNPSGNRVGIGTTTPYSILSVSSADQVAPATKLFTVASTTGASLFQVLASGTVGIATTAPAALLAVENTGAGRSFMVSDSANDATPFVIDSAGRVGIGTTTPYSATGVMMNVNAAAGANAVLALTQTGVPGFVAKLQVTTGSGGFFQLNNTSGTGAVAIRGYASSGVQATFNGIGNIGFGTTTPSALLAASSTRNVVARFDQMGTFDILQLKDAGTTVFKVVDGGYTGIGTNTPSSVLSVSTLAQAAPTTKLLTVASTTGTTLFQVLANGQTTIAGQALFAAGSAAAPAVSSSAAPDTGIYWSGGNTLRMSNGGTASWLFSLNELSNGNYTSSALLGETVSYTNPTVVANKSDLDTGLGGAVTNINQLSLIAGGNEVVRVSSTEVTFRPTGLKVGIGTTTPYSILSVATTDQQAPTYKLLTVASTTGASLFQVNAGGNVGIGVTNPTVKLAIQGIGTDTATLGVEKVSNGDFAANANGWTLGANWSWGGADVDHAVGSVETLEQNVSAEAGKTYSVAVLIRNYVAGTITVSIGGTAAGSTQFNNGTITYTITAVNTNNLIITPSSDFNGSVDNISVKEITAANALAVFNNSDGTAALEVRSGGINQNNTFVGLNAGKNDVSATGVLNSAFGTSAFSSNTTGRDNSAFGTFALLSNTVGGNNTALGTDTLYRNTVGSTNTAVGWGALFNNTSGSQNIALGYSAGFAQTSASGNILLGYQAGNNLTTGSNNIVLGYDIDAPSVTSANTLNIGNLFFGTGLDGTGTTLASGKIGIGTTTPAARLQVTSNTEQLRLSYLTDPTKYTSLTVNSGGDLTIAPSGGDTNITGNLTVSGTQTFTGASSLATTTIMATGTNPVLTVGQGGTGDIVQFKDGNNIVMKILDGGNVGIGTTTPYSVLSVSTLAQAAPTTKLFTVASTTGATILQVLANGNSGFGTTTPKSVLSVSTLAQAAGTTKLFTVASTTGSTLLQVQGSGLVGIGTTTPVANLTVAGSISARSFNGNTAASWGGPWFATGTKNLLAWYPLAKRDSQNDKMSDISGNERHGTITAGASAGFRTDWSRRMEGAYDFDGADTKIDTGSEWIGTQAVTISAWIYTDGYGEGGNGNILTNGKIDFDLTSVPSLRFSSNGGATQVLSGNTTLLSTWVHVLITRTAAGVANFYVNGVLSGAANQASGDPVAGTTHVILGNNTGQTATFDGKISDLRVYNRVLSASEAAALYQGSQSTYSTRLGIGTSTPASVLSVTTPYQTSASTKLFTVASTTGATLFQVLANGQSLFASGSQSAPSISFTSDPTSGFWRQGTSDIRLGLAGAQRWGWTTAGYTSFGLANGPQLLWQDSSATAVNIIPSISDTNTGIGRAGADQLSLIAGGAEIMRFNTVASSVNRLSATSSATGAAVQLGVQGSDTNVSMVIRPQGTGKLGVGTTTPVAFLSVQPAVTLGSTALLRVASSTNATLLTVEATGKVGIGLSNPSAYLHVVGTTEQFRLSYNTLNYWSTAINASGTATLLATGTDPGFNFKVRETTALSVNDAQITANVPLQVANSGDVGVAGDILLSNGTASYITAENPLTIRTYNPAQSVDLTLMAANNGVVVVDDALEIYGTTTIALTQFSANAFQIKNHLGTQMFNINNLTTSSLTTFTFGTNDGSVATATSLRIGYGGICVDNDGGCQASTTGRVTARSFGTNASDVAENYPSLEQLQPGDLVMADSNNDGYVVKTTGEYSNNVIGVVSSEPGIVLGAEVDGYPIALVGRIPTKVSNVNGPIAPGDALTVAPLAGYAMKMNDGDTSKVIGTALASFVGSVEATTGLISMFINPDYKSINNPESFGLITDGQIATNAAISDLKLGVIRTAGKIALSALPVEIALLQGDTQTFRGNYIFGANVDTSDLIVLNAKIGSDIKFAVDGLYNIGSADKSAANVYTKELNSSKIVIAADLSAQNMNIDDYGLYLAASSGNAFFGDNVVIGSNQNNIEVALPTYPDFALNGGDLLVKDDLGIAGNLYVVGDVRIAGALEFAREGIAQMMDVSGENLISGQLVVVNASGTTQGKVSDLANSSGILGVIGTSSAAIFGQNSVENQLPVIVSGMAVVNVSAENGPIQRGDKLTSSDTAGYAMLATRPGAGVLGLAMEDIAEGQGKIRVLVNLGTYYQPIAQVITVGNSGSDFKTITKALNSINDNSVQNRYLIKVAPGIYNEQITLKDYVDVVGDGANLATIESNESPVIIAGAKARLEGLTVKSTSNDAEPTIISLTNGTTETIVKEVILESESNNPAVGVSISGSVNRVMLNNLTFGSNFSQGIVNLASSTVIIMHSDLSQINGTAMIAQNGRVRSYYNNYNGVLGDINVAVNTTFESTGDQYDQVSNAGIFLDSTNQGKVSDDYIDYGLLAQNSKLITQNSPFLIDVSAGESYVNGVKVNISEVDGIEVYASSTNYILMSDAGQIVATTSAQALSFKLLASLLIAQVQTDNQGITEIINERANEVTVAKQGGKFRTITAALDSITSATENNHWTIKVGSGVYNEQVVLKQYVDIVGSGQDNTTIMAINKPVVVSENNGQMATSTQAMGDSKISGVKLSLAGDTLGQAVVSASSTNLTLEDVNISWSGSEGVNGTAVETNGAGNVNIIRLNAFGMAYGLTSNVITDGTATSTVNISYSNISTTIADIQTLNHSADASVSRQVNIISSYNTLSGTGTNFAVARSTIISSAHDTYLTYTGEGELRQNDYFRNNNNPTASLFNIQNAGINLFNVTASGTIAINPQNTTGDSVVINSATASSTLTVINSGAGTALRVIGNMILTSATSGIPVVLSSAGAELNVGAPGDTINLNVDGVTYNFKENVRRDTMSAYLSAPATGDQVWGNGSNAWSPAENITVLGVKVQYNCVDGGALQMVLKDKNGNTIANLNGYDCGGFYKIEENDLEYHLTPDDGMYVDVISSSEGITNVTVTIEFVYDNR